jgi:hypothetical protein
LARASRPARYFKLHFLREVLALGAGAVSASGDGKRTTMQLLSSSNLEKKNGEGLA